MLQHHVQSQNDSFQTVTKMKPRTLSSVRRPQLSRRHAAHPWLGTCRAKSAARGGWAGWSWHPQRQGLVQLEQRGRAWVGSSAGCACSGTRTSSGTAGVGMRLVAGGSVDAGADQSGGLRPHAILMTERASPLARELVRLKAQK